MKHQAQTLLAKIEACEAVVGIIGLGYVGLPLAIAFSEKGFTVLGFDVDSKKVEMLSRGECYIKHLDASRLAQTTGHAPTVTGKGGEGSNLGLFSATTDFTRLSEPDAILICVPTPLGSHKEPDMRYVESSASAVRTTLRPGQLVVLESTTYPGTTDDLLKAILESEADSSSAGEGERKSELKTLKCGKHYFLAFSPEREDPGNPSFGATNTPKVVGGVDPVSGDLAQALYDQIVERTVRVSSARVAEASKLMENIFRAVNIASVNELKIVFDRMGIDIWEVLDAAETKPFGFMRFNPGPGWGGHCVAGSEWLRIRGCGLSGVYRATELFKLLGGRFPTITTHNGIFVEPAGLQALALDPKSGDIGWFPVSTLYRGRYDGDGFRITSDDKRHLTVTSEHPMLVWRKEGFETVPAYKLAAGDLLPLVSDLGDACDNPVIDFLEVVPSDDRRRVWVRIRDRHWSEFETILKSCFGWTIRDSIRSNTVRLDRFLEIEESLGVQREDLVLLTGMGRARREWPSNLELTPDFARFVGYYLAEGCITEDRNAIRVRLTFNRDEIVYLDDVRSTLGRMGFPSSTYDDSTWHATTIKFSSLLLASLLDHLWGCGRRSEEMRIPDALIGLSTEHKMHLLSGLLRGDGDVWTRTGRSNYAKNDKRYRHRNTTAVVGFFSSSPVLLEQVVHLLQDLGFKPRYKKGKPQIRMTGTETVERLIPFFAGEKRERLEKVQKARTRQVMSGSDEPSLAPGLRVTSVATVEKTLIDGWVYSMEVEEAGTFTTSSGIGVHNCIPLDPFYLAWKAREAGVPTRFIELAGEINTRMPEYVVEKLQLALNDREKHLKRAKILLLGLAYKKDIDDPRESPAFELITRLLELGAEVSYHDPHIPEAPTMRSWPDLPPMSSVPLTAETLQSVDAVLIATDHKDVDYDSVLENAPLIIDTRGVYRNKNDTVQKA